uniref:Regulating synaptic membrane exocytosis 2a n=1 Tax=Sinocyclocheilus rhinocerous TaxID=307959 RepID=A0A673JKC4_9TELE
YSDLNLHSPSPSTYLTLSFLSSIHPSIHPLLFPSTSTSIGGDMCSLVKTDGSQSDTAVSLVGTVDKKRRSSIGAKMAAVVGLSRKSRSASQLSQTGRRKKLRSTIQRSTETGLAVEMRSRMTRQASRESTDGSMNSYNYGRMDHKSFMGAAQILLDDLDMSNMVIGWFKLFPPSSLVDPTLAPLTRRASQSSLDSGSGPFGRS